MKIKALLFGLLTLTGSVLAMEPIEPIAQPPAPSAPETDVQKRARTNTIDLDSQCMVCIEEAKKIPSEELRLTNCCHNFMCKPCEDQIRKIAQANADQYATAEGQIQFIQQNGYAPKDQLKALCPTCKDDLRTRLASTQQPLKVIDIIGTKFTLEPKLAAALLKCSLILKAYESNGGVLDFSGISYKKYAFLTQDYIVRLAQIIDDPEKGRSESIEQDLKMFEIAHYSGAPNNILFIIANELWPLMQDQVNDAKETKEYKNYVRELARPHLSSPRHFLKYLQTNHTASNFCREHCIEGVSPLIKLHFSLIKHLMKRAPGSGWYKYNNEEWYANYPFYTLDGITELLKHLGVNVQAKDILYKNWSLDLSGHRLEIFSCDFMTHIDTLDLSNNNIKQLCDTQLAYTDRLPHKIILNNNPINSIENSFFEALRRTRATRFHYLEISLENCGLSNEHKQEIRKKFHKATTTIPERYLNENKFYKSFATAGCLAGTAASLYGCYKLANYTPKLMKGISIGTATTLGALIGTLRELFTSNPSNGVSVPWMCFDIAAGAIGSYFGSKALYNYQPGLTKVLPMAVAGLAGAASGAIAGLTGGTIIANCLAKLSHPEINMYYRGNPSHEEAWRNGKYTIKL